MKMHIKLLSKFFFFLLPCLPLKSLATGDDEVEKRKNISKSYTVTPEQKLRIENSFGEVKINTWDKNEIKVDIEIFVRSSTDERAQRILDDITVSESQDANQISYRTNVGNNNKDNGKGKNGNMGFHIDYKVYMPEGNRLQIENSFGRTIVPDFSGEVNLTSKFGSLTTGKLEHVDAIDVEFGHVSIASINNGKVTFKYDEGSSIGKISGSVKINSEFCSRVQFVVDDNIEELMINESYSTLSMVVSKDLSAHFEIHSSFGKVHNETAFSINEDKDSDNDTGPHFDNDYSGKAGDGKARVKVKSSFGTLRITHTAESNMWHDKKNKENKDNDDSDDDDSDSDQKKVKQPA